MSGKQQRKPSRTAREPEATVPIERWRCRLPGCDAWIDPDEEHLWEHLVGPPHLLGNGEANEIVDRDRRRRQHLTLDVGRMRGWRLKTFPAGDLAGRRALGQARQMLDTFSLGAYIDGPTGTGKTGLALGICHAVIDLDADNPDLDIDPWYVEFENVRALLARLRAGFQRREPVVLDHLLDDYRTKLVVLDDVGAERPTDYAVETLALIVEHRHALGTPLIVTTNYPPGELARRLSPDGDPVIGQRIVSRLLDDATRIRLERPDLRVGRELDDGDIQW